MPSNAPQSFVRAFNSANITKELAFLPIFLIPTAAKSTLSQSPRPKLCQNGYRRNASTRTPSVSSPDTHLSSDNDCPTADSGLKPPLSIKYRKEPRAWAELIEAYLPLHLRQGEQNIVETLTQFTDLHSIHTLPLLLSKARSYARVDLLSYLGVFQGRWDAVMWLVKAMMETYPDLLRRETDSRKLPILIRTPPGQSLDVITDHAVQTVFPQYSNLSLDSLTQNEDFNPQKPPVTLGRQHLGQIWQSLGTMILQAADRSAEDPCYSATMSFVFQILAHLHHIEAFPNSIYNYTPAEDMTVVQRPPTLHLLSRRIMSTLSDLEWGLQWQAEILKYQKLGYELTKASVPPKIRQFGPELWLDLVLWACVEGGWIKEAAWIVTEMERRKGSASTQWSVISWQDICAHKEPKLDWPSIMKLQIERTTLNQVGGIGIASGPDSTVNMGERTVSREVVLAIMDGLLNTASPEHSSPRSSSLSSVQQSIMACKSLLERHYPQLDQNFLNANILRILESFGLNTKDMPGLLHRLLSLRDLKPKGIHATSTSMSVQDSNTDDTAAFLGLLHRNLNSFAKEDNLQGSLLTFRQIQTLVDQERTRLIEDFAGDLKKYHRQGDADMNFDFVEESNISTIHPNIPANAFIAFVNLITDSKYYELGKWLLLNDDIDGGAVDPELYTDPKLQPALLQFATATADGNLLTKVLERLETPLSEPILHAILRCQIALGKWEAVEDLLGHFQKTPGMDWAVSDATAIARAIMQIEHSAPDSATQGQMKWAYRLLYDLVHGRYNTAHNPSKPYDFSQTRLANQLGRIFRSLPGSLSKLSEETSHSTERAHTSIEITSNSFNTILETVVEYNGSMAGKQLWERWCRDPTEVKLSPSICKSPVSMYGNNELVVTPTLHMLRNILHPVVRALDGETDGDAIAVKKGTASNTSLSLNYIARIAGQQDDQQVIDWAISMFRKFGLSEKAIKKEIPGSLPRVRTEKLGDIVGP